MAKNTQVVKLKAQVKELKAEVKAAKKSEQKVVKTWARLVAGVSKILNKASKQVVANPAAKKPAKSAKKRVVKKTKAVEEE